jgi:hypothetical protein
MLKRVLAGLGLALALTAAPAHAAVIVFTEDFNAENGGVGALNYNSFTNFTVSSGTVDLIGNGFFDFPPVTTGHGLYVDLDGSTSDAGLMLANPIPVTPGEYELFFQLAGNQRNAGPDIVQVSLFLDGVLVYNPPGNVLVPQDLPFLGQILPFTVTSAGNLTFSFQNNGGDNIGALLDNITVTQLRAAPEPASMLLFGSALAIGLVRRRR